MRTADIILRSGDRLPSISRTVKVDGVLVDLTGYTATFNYQPIAGGALVSRAATISATPTDGTVSYAWSSADAATAAGFYAAWFEVTKTSLTLSVPNDGFLLLQIVADGAAEFSYSGDPSARPIDAIRYLIQDVDAAHPKQRDSEILWALSQNTNTYMAAAACADAIAAIYAAETLVSRTVGDLSISESGRTNRSEEYRNLANRLRAQAMRLSAPMPSAGGLDSGFQFAIGEQDNPSSADVDLPRWQQQGESGA